jgi:hypothetical protein
VHVSRIPKRKRGRLGQQWCPIVTCEASLTDLKIISEHDRTSARRTPCNQDVRRIRGMSQVDGSLPKDCESYRVRALANPRQFKSLNDKIISVWGETPLSGQAFGHPEITFSISSTILMPLAWATPNERSEMAKIPRYITPPTNTCSNGRSGSIWESSNSSQHAARFDDAKVPCGTSNSQTQDVEYHVQLLRGQLIPECLTSTRRR